MRKTIRITSGLVIMLISVPFMLLAIAICCTIVGLPIGILMYLGAAVVAAMGYRLIRGIPVNYTSLKEEKYAKRAQRRDARHNKKFA